MRVHPYICTYELRVVSDNQSLTRHFRGELVCRPVLHCSPVHLPYRSPTKRTCRKKDFERSIRNNGKTLVVDHHNACHGARRVFWYVDVYFEMGLLHVVQRRMDARKISLRSTFTGLPFCMPTNHQQSKERPI